MADGTQIEWTDATVNAVNGCTRVSPGCGGPGPHGGCYAERLAGTRLRNHPSRAGLTKQTSSGPRWTGEVRLNEKALLEPLGWKRPRRIFWNAHGDLFHENVPDEWIDRCFAVMALTPQHQHQVLTKRAERMRAWFDRAATSGGRLDIACAADDPLLFDVIDWPLPNVWLGVSVEDQTRADERIPHLLATPAAVRFLSCEPLLGPVDLGAAVRRAESLIEYFQRVGDRVGDREIIDWVIVGGESGPKARPMALEWAQSLVDQCRAAAVPCFVKQLGASPTRNGKRWNTDSKKGGDPAQWPECLRVREMPGAR